MTNKIIESFTSLHKTLTRYSGKVVVFRGVTDAKKHKLIPSIGRLKKFGSTKDALKEERYILQLFKQRSRPYLDFAPANEWEWLALAQHHGLPTRLLDRTYNPLVAAYFAVEQPHKGDSAIFAYHNKTFINITKNPIPFAIKRNGKLIPSHISRRITAQAGLFTAHPDPIHEFTDSNIQMLIIPQHFRSELKKQLEKYGIHRASLFPDLDGVAQHIKWKRTKEK